jgi:hypothetical protein
MIAIPARRRLVLLGAALALLAAPLASAPPLHAGEGEGPEGATYVLAVGIDGYLDAAVPPLRFAENDARAVFRFFATERSSPAGRDRSSILVGAAATRVEVLAAIEEKLARRAVRPEDTAIFYFAGHGFADATDTYLAPVDVQLRRLAATAITQGQLADAWGKVRAGRKLIILDACRSGGIEGLRGIGGVAQAPLPAPAGAAAGAAVASVVIAAAQANEVSAEDAELGQGCFTLALLKGLRGEADDDRDGIVTDAEVERYLAVEVPALAAQAGGRQTPLVRRISAGAPLVLARAPGARATPLAPPRPSGEPPAAGGPPAPPSGSTAVATAPTAPPAHPTSPTPPTTPTPPTSPATPDDLERARLARLPLVEVPAGATGNIERPLDPADLRAALRLGYEGSPAFGALGPAARGGLLARAGRVSGRAHRQVLGGGRWEIAVVVTGIDGAPSGERVVDLGHEDDRDLLGAGRGIASKVLREVAGRRVGEGTLDVKSPELRALAALCVEGSPRLSGLSASERAEVAAPLLEGAQLQVTRPHGALEARAYLPAPGQPRRFDLAVRDGDPLVSVVEQWVDRALDVRERFARATLESREPVAKSLLESGYLRAALLAALEVDPAVAALPPEERAALRSAAARLAGFVRAGAAPGGRTEVSLSLGLVPGRQLLIPLADGERVHELAARIIARWLEAR